MVSIYPTKDELFQEFVFPFFFSFYIHIQRRQTLERFEFYIPKNRYPFTGYSLFFFFFSVLRSIR